MNAKHLEVVASEKTDALEMVQQFLEKFDFTYPAKIRISAKGPPEAYYALIAIWSKEVAQQQNKRLEKLPKTHEFFGQRLKPKTVRKWWYHTFIGYEPSEKILKTQVGESLRHIKDLGDDRGELYNFARQVEEWCVNEGFNLSQPNSQYKEDEARQNM